MVEYLQGVQSDAEGGLESVINRTNGRTGLRGTSICRDRVEKSVARAPGLCRCDLALRAHAKPRHEACDSILTDITVAVPIKRWKFVAATGLRLLGLADTGLATESK